MSSIEISEAGGVRHLHFGSELVQGAMRIARPWALELEYTREMMLPLLLHAGAAWPRSVLQVGLGAASFTRFLHRHRPKARVTVVEISPAVVAAARQFFKLPDESPRLAIEIADGHDWLAAATRRFDLILVDGFDAEGRAGMLESLPFYLNARSRLNAGGMLATNLLTRSRSVAPVARRLREAFEGRVAVLPPCGAGNTVAIAARDGEIRLEPSELRDPARRLKEETGLDLSAILERLGPDVTSAGGPGKPGR
ncbi:MAG: fused MFS/spermidine synthase [Lysobacter sp.]|nr:fused MFS/spermidine synthase [Lysobacter sp.]